MIKNFVRALLGLVLLGGVALPAAPTTIIAANFSGAANVTGGLYKITQPGTYVLGADVALPVGRSNVAMIQIVASNVILDLNGKSLSLSTTNRMPCAKGILLSSGCKNVVVKNGLINGSNGYVRVGEGISCQGNSNVTIQNIVVQGCRLRGFYADNSKSFVISNTVFDGIYNSDQAPTPTRHGFFASDCADFILNNVSCSFNRSTTSAVCGMFLNQCSNFTCENVRAIDNSGVNNPIELGNVAYPNVLHNAAACIGFSLCTSRNMVFKNCKANDNGGSDSNHITHCYGFYFSNSRNALIQDCEASNNFGNFRVAGILVQNSSGDKIVRCEANNNFSVFQASVYGILVENDGSSNERFGASVVECEAFGNRVTNLDDGSKAFGIAFIGLNSGTIERCMVGSNWSRDAYGIGLLSINPGANSPRPTERINIVNNTILHNPGITKRYGFYDDAEQTTNFLRGNIAYGHGLAVNRYENQSANYSNFYFNYNNGDNQIDGIVEKNSFVLGYNPSSDADSWKNYSIN